MTGTKAFVTPLPHRLPREIWWLINEKAAEGGSVESLFLLARLCRDMAHIALPLMYGKVKDNGVSDDHSLWVFSTEGNLLLWRSIIMSSLGKTLYPYCLWIKALDIGNLQFQLSRLVNEPDLRPKFYSPPLDYLEVLDKSKTSDSDDMPGSNALLFEVTNEITKYIKSMADQGQGLAKVVSLRDPNLGYSTSSVHFPIWVSRLAGLTTLYLFEGSHIEDHIAASLVQHCPAFKHLYVSMTT